MVKSKKMIALFLVFTMLLGLCACSQDTQQTEPAEQETIAVTKDEEQVY